MDQAPSGAVKARNDVYYKTTVDGKYNLFP